MWIIQSLGASLMWGLCYAISGKLYEKGMSVVVYYFLSSGVTFIGSGAYLWLSGKAPSVLGDLASIRQEWHWLFLSLTAASMASLSVSFAVVTKNATMAALIESSYPIFVAITAWVFFNQSHLSMTALLGGILIMAGGVMVALGR